MDMEKNSCTKEGLFITELTDEFFEKCMSENKELESFIMKLSDKVKMLLKQENSGIWHCIFEILIKELFPKGFKGWHECNSDNVCLSEPERVLRKLILEFYDDPFIITYDIAQTITYNLYRLGKKETYNMDDEEDIEYLINDENINELLYIGRKKYGRDKNIADDLIEDLEKLWKNSTEQEPPVYFPMKIDGKRITLELDFLPLNVLFIGNEQFRNYICDQGKSRKYFEMLMEQIQILNDKDTAPLQYVWEKSTNFNTVNAMAKFLITLINEEKKKHKISNNEIEAIVKRVISCELFYAIRFMPNVLTKLLVIKTVFNYIGEYLISLNFNPRRSKGELENLDYLIAISSDEFVWFLSGLNNRYKRLQEHLLPLATILRWHIDKKSKEKWISELEKEYSMDLFETLYLSLNLNDDLQIRTPWKEHKQEEIDLNNKEYRCLVMEYGHPTTDYQKISNYIKFKKKCELLNKFKDKKYSGNSEELAEELYEEEWGTIDGCLEKIKEGENDERFIQWDDLSENINRNIKYCLLSDYKNIIFENTEIEDDELFKTIMNCLLSYSSFDLHEPDITTRKYEL